MEDAVERAAIAEGAVARVSSTVTRLLGELNVARRSARQHATAANNSHDVLMLAALAEEEVARLSTLSTQLEDWLADIATVRDRASVRDTAAPAPEGPPQVYTLTAFPEIFKYTLWGGGQSGASAVIVSNRNLFASAYAIKTVDRNQVVACYVSYGANGRFRKMFDHSEMYRTNDGRFILVVSPYNHVSNSIDEFTATCGFIVIPPLYQEHAISMVKIGGVKDFIDYRVLLGIPQW